MLFDTFARFKDISNNGDRTPLIEATNKEVARFLKTGFKNFKDIPICVIEERLNLRIIKQ